MYRLLNLKSNIQTMLSLGDKKLSIQQLIQIDKTLASVPPSQEYATMTGKLTMTITMDYINLPFQKFFEFRYALWGSSEKLYFQVNSNKSQLKITASIQMLSRYLWDMNILCIQVVSTMQSRTDQDPSFAHRIKSPSSLKSPRHNNMSTQEKKIVGYIYIPLRKYFINHTMSSFSLQKFAIIDQNKKRIGEVGVDFRIDMLEGNGVGLKNYLNKVANNNTVPSYEYSQRKNERLYSREKHQVSIMDKHSVANRFSYEETQTFLRPNQKKVTISNRSDLPTQQKQRQNVNKKQQPSSKKNYLTHQQMNFQDQQDKEIINQAQQLQEDNNRFYRRDMSNRKQLKSYKKSLSKEETPKAQHTDLSLIKMKWGTNHPTVELMKLRLDEAKYLNNSTVDSINGVLDLQQQQQQITRMNIYLKQFTLLLAKSIAQLRYLSISHLTKNSNVVFRTQINLQSLVKNIQTSTINLNHLIVLNSVKMTDKLVVQTVDSFAEVPMKELLNSNIVDLRRKDNKKRVYELKYNMNLLQSKQPIQQIENIHPNRIKQQRPIDNKQKSIQKQKILNVNGGIKKTKQINEIISEGGKPLPNKSKPKINKIIPQKQNGQLAPQQSQLKSPYHKLIANSQVNSKQQKQEINLQKLLTSTFKYFELLYMCEDQSCFQLVNKLLNQDKSISQQGIKKVLYQLEILLKITQKNDSSIIEPLSLIVENLFRSNFASFYKCFQSYKEINQRYQTVLYKLKKIIFLSQQDSISRKRQPNILQKIVVILDYVKKHKKDKIAFGLIKQNDLFQIICEKLLPTNQEMTFNPKNSKEQQKVITQKSQLILQKNNSKIAQSQISKCIQYLLTLFTRYQQNYIKIKQMQSNLEQFIKLKRNQKVEIRQMNMNLGFSLNLHKQVTENDEDFHKYKETFLCYFIEDNYDRLFRNLKINKQLDDQQKKLSLYELLFEDPLSLQDIQSSIHFTHGLKTQQQQEYPLITEQQEGRNYQRFRTQNDRINFSKMKMYQRQMGYVQERGRLNTEQISKGEKNRLNTQDENVIEFMNYKKSGVNKINKQQQPISYINNKQIIHNNQYDEVISIQVTKKEQFHQVQIEKSQQNISKSDVSQNNNNKDESLISHQQVYKKAKTNYISVTCTLINPTQIRSRDKSWPNAQDKSQFINLFYLHSKKDEGVNQKQIVEQFKLQAKQVGSVPKYVPNNFQMVQQKSTPVQQYTFRVEQNHQFSSKKSSQSFNNNNQKITIKVKNHLGKQQYPIQNSQGQIIYIIQIEIQQVDQFQQKIFQEQKQTQLLTVLNNDKQKDSDKFNRMLILNMNKLYCLNPMQEINCLRLIYEAQNEIQLIKDVQIFKQEDKKFVLSDQKYEDENILQTRVLPINVDFIKMKNLNNPQKKHILKIFNVKKSQLNKANINQSIKEDLTVIKSNPANKMKSRTSQPVSRFLDDDKMQNTFQAPLDFICQFQFTFNSHPGSKSGIYRHNRWLIDGSYRLQIDLFDILYEKWTDQQQNQSTKNALVDLDKLQLWQKKIQKILTVFKIKNQQKVRQKIQNLRDKQEQKRNNKKYEDFLTIISEVMGYRLTEKQIFANLCFPSSIEVDNQQDQKLSTQQKYNYLSQLFSIDQFEFNMFDGNKKSSDITSLKALYQEFETFDLEHEGLLTMVKFQVIKKILPELNFLDSQKFTVNLLKSQQKLGINDCKISQKQSKKPLVDYLKILWECRKNYEQNFFFELSKHQQKSVKQNIKPSHLNKKNIDKKLPQFYKIAIKQFKNLMLNNIPCTLQFRIDSKRLFQPIYRCYSHQFSQNNWSVVKLNKQNQQTFTLEVFNRIVSSQNKRIKQDLYEYKMLQKFDLRKILEDLYKNKEHQHSTTFQLICQNLDGSILIEIQYLDSKQQYEYSLKKQNAKNNVDFSSQDEQNGIKKLQKEEKSKFLKKQIDSNLKRQFYQDQQSQNQQSYQRQIVNQRKNNSKSIGELVMKAFNIQSNKKDVSRFQQKLKLERDQTLLSQTRKQWQTMLSKNIQQDEFDGQEKNRMKQSRLQQVLKKAINKEEINRKFQLFKGDGFGDSSQDEIESD